MEAGDHRPEQAEQDRDEARVRQARLLRAASHDIRGPLANVRSYASLLSDPRMELPDKARRSIDVICRNADKALALLREFIDSEQAAKGVLELPLETVAVGPVVQKALRAAAPILEEKNVRVAVDERIQTAVHAEPGALEHIIRVLVEHAAERSSPGSEVRLEMLVEAGEALLRVEDRGAPLSDAEQAQLFDRDAHLERRQKLTTGFRLSLAFAEAETMGGALEVRSSAQQTSLQLRLAAAGT